MTAVEKKVIPFPQTPVRRRDYELAFLPAALEITETPPSPTRRAVGLAIIALFCLAVGWASLGTTDIVAIAPGKIVPSGRTKLICSDGEFGRGSHGQAAGRCRDNRCSSLNEETAFPFTAFSVRMTALSFAEFTLQSG